MSEIKTQIKQSNAIIKGIDAIAEKVVVKSGKIKQKAIDKAIKINGTKPAFSAASLVQADIDNNLRAVINDVNQDFTNFVKATSTYLANNYAIKLTAIDLDVISKKNSVIIDSLVANTEVLKSDIQGMLTQNLGAGISEKQLVQELQDLYPAYASNAGTILNTGTGRLFIDINVSKFKKQDFKWYLWAGPDDAITRARPCKHWVWHKFAAKDLATITATRMTLWNCRHSIIPIPEEEIDNYPTGDLKFA